MADSRRYQDWFDKANGDLSAARILMKGGGEYPIVAFHCQQAIEKALKGFILLHTRELKEGHSLIYLIKIAGGVDDRFKAFRRDCAFVNQFYIETRYPSDVPLELVEEDAQECLEIAERIVEEATRA